MKTILFIADDWGLSDSIHQTITHLHRQRAIEAAGIMMGQAFTPQAVDYALANPDLRVGLHLFASDDDCRPLTRAKWPLAWPDRSWINPALVLPTVRQLAEEEIRAQLEAYRETGLPLHFVNSHFQFHPNPLMDAAVLAALDEVFPDFDGWIRLGAVRLFPGLMPDEAMDFIHGGLGPLQDMLFHSRWAGKRNDTLWGLNRVFGNRAGEIVEAWAGLGDGFHEFFFHPGRATRLSDPGTDEGALLQLARLLPREVRLPAGLP